MENNIENKRRIIYVDAYFDRETGKSKISLYDPEENQKNILTVSAPTSTTRAEQCAILYGCMYLQKIGNERRAYILNDNQGAITNTKIVEVCKKLNLGVSWIPREINTIADEGIRLEDNIDPSEANILIMFYNLIFEDGHVKKESSSNNQKIENEKSILQKAVQASKKVDKPYVAIGQIGKHLKENYPNFKYNSLKKEFMKYEQDFVIVNNNFVKEIK